MLGRFCARHFFLDFACAASPNFITHNNTGLAPNKSNDIARSVGAAVFNAPYTDYRDLKKNAAKPTLHVEIRMTKFRGLRRRFARRIARMAGGKPHGRTASGAVMTTYVCCGKPTMAIACCSLFSLSWTLTFMNSEVLCV